MKKILLATLCFLFFNSSFGQPNYLQYFDGANTNPSNSLIVNIDGSSGNIWQIGKPQKIIFDSAATAPNVLITDTINNYPVNNLSKVTFNIYTYMTHGILALQWKQKIDMENKKDGGMVEYSVDYGASWQSAFNNPHVYNFFGYPSPDFDTLNTGEYAFSGTDSLWQDVWLCYDLMWISTFVDTLKVRFTFKSDSVSTAQEGWMIDNMNAHITITHPVKENVQNDFFNVYPNPAKNRINIELQKGDEYNIIEKMELVSADGKLVKEWRKIPTRYWIDVSGYPDGMYFLKINSTLKSKTIPITIQK